MDPDFLLNVGAIDASVLGVPPPVSKTPGSNEYPSPEVAKVTVPIGYPRVAVAAAPDPVVSVTSLVKVIAGVELYPDPGVSTVIVSSRVNPNVDVKIASTPVGSVIVMIAA